MCKNRRFFTLAKKHSVKSDHYQHKIGCIIVNKSKIISTGWNLLKSHTKSPHPWSSIHAEFMAVKTANKDELEGATIYLYRENRQGEPAISRPCTSCYHMLKKAGIKLIRYSDKDGFKEEYL